MNIDDVFVMPEGSSIYSSRHFPRDFNSQDVQQQAMSSATVEDSMYEERWYPPPLPHADGVRWYHKATENAEVFVKPSTEQVTLSGTVEFTLVNRSDQPLEGDSSKLYKLEEGRWHPLTYAGGIIRSLQPDDEETYRLQLFRDEVDTRGRAGVYGPLGGGIYAFDTGYRTEVRYKSLGLAVAAIITVEGDPIELTPEENIHTERHDTTVTVTDARFEQADDSHRYTLAVERVEPDGQPLITEQLMHGPYSGLRNCVPLFDEEIDRVVLRSDASVSSLVSSGNGPANFEYEGEGFEVRRLQASAD